MTRYTFVHSLFSAFRFSIITEWLYVPCLLPPPYIHGSSRALAVFIIFYLIISYNGVIPGHMNTYNIHMGSKTRLLNTNIIAFFTPSDSAPEHQEHHAYWRMSAHFRDSPQSKSFLVVSPSNACVPLHFPWLIILLDHHLTNETQGAESWAWRDLRQLSTSHTPYSWQAGVCGGKEGCLQECVGAGRGGCLRRVHLSPELAACRPVLANESCMTNDIFFLSFSYLLSPLTCVYYHYYHHEHQHHGTTTRQSLTRSSLYITPLDSIFLFNPPKKSTNTELQ